MKNEQKKWNHVFMEYILEYKYIVLNLEDAHLLDILRLSNTDTQIPKKIPNSIQYNDGKCKIWKSFSTQRKEKKK